VGEVEVFGGQYAMRIWVDTDKLISYNLTFSDLALALRSYNVEISAGQFGELLPWRASGSCLHHGSKLFEDA
jgi:multidrug efflux pump subunit AcrB